MQVSLIACVVYGPIYVAHHIWCPVCLKVNTVKYVTSNSSKSISFIVYVRTIGTYINTVYHRSLPTEPFEFKK